VIGLFVFLFVDFIYSVVSNKEALAYAKVIFEIPFNRFFFSL